MSADIIIYKNKYGDFILSLMPYFISADKAISTEKDKSFQVITRVACGVLVAFIIWHFINITTWIKYKHHCRLIIFAI